MDSIDVSKPHNPEREEPVKATVGPRPDGTKRTISKEELTAKK